jgi:hypothetical protein
MPALAHVPPAILKQVLEFDGWKVTHEDHYNWLLEKAAFDPLPIPKRTKLISFEIHEHCLAVAKIDGARYFELLAKVGFKH